MPILAESKALLDEYLSDLEGRRAFSQAGSARWALPHFLAHLDEQGVQDLRDVSVAHLHGWLVEQRGRKTRLGTLLSPATEQVYVAVLRSFFGFLERRGLVLFNPARLLTLPRARRLPKHVLGLEQARRLMEVPSDATPAGLRDRALLELLYGTGLRCAELARLDVTDVDLAQGQILVRGGKGRKDRFLPLTRRANAALDRYLREARPDLAGDEADAALFLNARHGRLMPFSFRGHLKRHAHRAGIPFKVTPHSLRHAYATHLLRGGASVRHVQQLLGHESLDTTMLYTRVAIADLKKAIARSHPRGRIRRRTRK